MERSRLATCFMSSRPGRPRRRRAAAAPCRRAARSTRRPRTARCRRRRSGPGSAATSSNGGDDQERGADGHEQRPVHERAQDAARVLVDDAADAELAAAGEREDAVDPVGEPAQVRERGQQLVADHRRRGRSARRGRSTSSTRSPRSTSDSSGASTRSVPSRVTSARDSTTRSVGQADAEARQRRDEVLQHRRVDGAGRRARGRPCSRASARSSSLRRSASR